MVRKTAFALLFSFTTVTTSIFAQSFEHSHHAIAEMAKMMLQFEHRISAAGMSTLDAIINSNQVPDNEKVLAQAIKNLDHKVKPDDKASLTALINNSSTTAEVREMANILLHVDHRVSAKDKKKLQKFATLDEVSPDH